MPGTEKSGLPTTYFDGLNSWVGGDNDDERKKPPKDRQPCDRFTRNHLHIQPL